jgi:hypothetical protein
VKLVFGDGDRGAVIDGPAAPPPRRAPPAARDKSQGSLF